MCATVVRDVEKIKTMGNINLVFPHQLFEHSPLFSNGQEFYLVEERLFFTQYNFHKQKIAFHRASMKYYEKYLTDLGKKVYYIASDESTSDIRELITQFAKSQIKEIGFVDLVDDWLATRIKNACGKHGITTHEYDSPSFLNSLDVLRTYFKKERKKYHQTQFYIEQRKTRHLLLDESGKALGGKWTFDTDNRKKYPSKKVPPPIHYPASNTFFEEAQTYVDQNFNDNFGELGNAPLYPTNFDDAKEWLQQFLEYRFHDFGAYEDAIVQDQHILNHSVLTPMLNVGLLTPDFIVEESISFGKQAGIPLNSIEGFIRQIVGWREFIRGIYTFHGRAERTRNFWGFKRKMPSSFYDGTTGIPPIDHTIKKVLKTGYCHHIERLMVLGNFMLLCEIDPDDVYQWFMELFIDAYDWVMVPNIYGMSQFSDGGLFATKPYISGSNYLLKMGNYQKGEWQSTWDGLFWRFMDTHRSFFLKNPRLGMLVRTFDKMEPEKKATHLKNAEHYLSSL
ncbi:cryptochrome/photolyase family protein [Flavobacteriaceae bacterium GF1]